MEVFCVWLPPPPYVASLFNRLSAAHQRLSTLVLRGRQRSITVCLMLAVLLAGSGSALTASAAPASLRPHTVASHCPTVPANFDFAHASRQELHQYLLPSRPPSGDPKEVAEWQRTVTDVVHSVCVPDTNPLPAIANGKPVIFNSCSTPPPQTTCSANWDGYIVGNGSQPGFNDVIGKWTIPCVSSFGVAYQMGNWVGLGGY